MKGERIISRIQENAFRDNVPLHYERHIVNRPHIDIASPANNIVEFKPQRKLNIHLHATICSEPSQAFTWHRICFVVGHLKYKSTSAAPCNRKVEHTKV